MMDLTLRHFFDEQVDCVLKQLPKPIRKLLKKVPLHVEDYPAKHLMREMRINDRRGLLGLFSGRTVGEHPGTTVSFPAIVTIYREGIYDQCLDEEGFVDEEKLRKQIRITILHELAHYHGMTEAEIDAIGYG